MKLTEVSSENQMVKCIHTLNSPQLAILICYLDIKGGEKCTAPPGLETQDPRITILSSPTEIHINMNL